MFDPLELTERVESKVLKGLERKYYRMRPARFYGGIASADCSGCNLRCVFCWSNDLAREGKLGTFYSPQQVAQELLQIARRKGYTQLRITGNEPTLCFEHLCAVLEKIPASYDFILETNGILLGAEEKYAEELRKFPNLHVRVSLKGCTPEEFSRLTGASPQAFELQLKALENCKKFKVSCHAAVMLSFSTDESYESLLQKLKKISPRLAQEVEDEYVFNYPHVVQRLKQAKLKPFNSYSPSCIPEELI